MTGTGDRCPQSGIWQPYPHITGRALGGDGGMEIALSAGDRFPPSHGEAAVYTLVQPTRHPVGALGRFVEHDERSRAFPAATAEPGTVLWRHYGTVLNQGRLGSCTGNAITQCMMTAPFRQPSRKLYERDALRCYELATSLDNIPGSYPPNDTGSSGLGVAKAAQKLGWCSSYTHAFGIDHARGAIGVSPFIVGTSWTQDMFTPDSDGFVTPTGQVEGGHEWLMLGYQPAANPNDDIWTALNSWGRSWSLHGVFHLRGGDFAELLADSGDITVPVS